jgi:serine protease Do
MKITHPRLHSRTLSTTPCRQLAARRSPAADIAAGIALSLLLAAPLPGVAQSSAANATPVSPAVGQHRGFADLVERVRPAVVNVSTRSRATKASAHGLPFKLPKGSPFAERFREFMEKNQRQAPDHGTPQSGGVGSGFIVDADGYVVTNNHVIDGADEIFVTLSDKTKLKAEVVGHDSKTDLALLRVRSDDKLPFVAFGNSNHARVGDWVVAVGSPFGLGGTVTAGILSARGRDINSGPFDDYLQVDAPINRGNSGGPLFDDSGQVIGVNTAIFSPSGGSVGIGFAIPSEIAAQVIDALKADGHVKRGWMGVNIQSLNAELAQGFGLDEPKGALVAGVLEDGPAARAGVEVGDIILRFDAHEIKSMRDLPRAVAATKAGRNVAVEVLRSGKQLTITLNVGDMPGNEQQALAAASTPMDELLGVTLSALDTDIRAQLGLDEGASGVLITEVTKGSPAAREGLRAGDLILRVGNGKVSTPEQVSNAMREVQKSERDRVLMLVSRNGNERFVAVPFERG